MATPMPKDSEGTYCVRHLAHSAGRRPVCSEAPPRRIRGLEVVLSDTATVMATQLPMPSAVGADCRPMFAMRLTTLINYGRGTLTSTLPVQCDLATDCGVDVGQLFDAVDQTVAGTAFAPEISAVGDSMPPSTFELKSRVRVLLRGLE